MALPFINTTWITNWFAQQGASAFAKVFATSVGNLFTQVLLVIIGFGGGALMIGGVLLYMGGEHIAHSLGAMLVFIGILMVLPTVLHFIGVI